MKGLRVIFVCILFLLCLVLGFATAGGSGSTEDLEEKLKNDPTQVDWATQGAQAWEAVLTGDGIDYSKLPEDAYKNIPGEQINVIVQNDNVKEYVVKNWDSLGSKGELTDVSVVAIIGETRRIGSSAPRSLSLSGLKTDSIAGALKEVFKGKLSGFTTLTDAITVNGDVISTQNGDTSIDQLDTRAISSGDVSVDKDGKITVSGKKTQTVGGDESTEGLPRVEGEVASSEPALDLTKIASEEDLKKTGFEFSVPAGSDGGVAQKVKLPQGEEIYVHPGSTLKFKDGHFVVETGKSAVVGTTLNQDRSITISEIKKDVVVLGAQASLADREILKRTSQNYVMLRPATLPYVNGVSNDLIGVHGSGFHVEYTDVHTGKQLIKLHDTAPSTLDIIGRTEVRVTKVGDSFFIGGLKIDPQNKAKQHAKLSEFNMPSKVTVLREDKRPFDQEYTFQNKQLAGTLTDGKLTLKITGDGSIGAFLLSIGGNLDSSNHQNFVKNIFGISIDELQKHGQASFAQWPPDTGQVIETKQADGQVFLTTRKNDGSFDSLLVKPTGTGGTVTKQDIELAIRNKFSYQSTSQVDSTSFIAKLSEGNSASQSDFLRNMAPVYQKEIDRLKSEGYNVANLETFFAFGGAEIDGTYRNGQHYHDKGTSYETYGAFPLSYKLMQIWGPSVGYNPSKEGLTPEQYNKRLLSDPEFNVRMAAIRLSAIKEGSAKDGGVNFYAKNVFQGKSYSPEEEARLISYIGNKGSKGLLTNLDSIKSGTYDFGNYRAKNMQNGLNLAQSSSSLLQSSAQVGQIAQSFVPDYHGWTDNTGRTNLAYYPVATPTAVAPASVASSSSERYNQIQSEINAAYLTANGNKINSQAAYERAAKYFDSQSGNTAGSFDKLVAERNILRSSGASTTTVAGSAVVTRSVMQPPTITAKPSIIQRDSSGRVGMVATANSGKTYEIDYAGLTPGQIAVLQQIADEPTSFSQWSGKSINPDAGIHCSAYCAIVYNKALNYDQYPGGAIQLVNTKDRISSNNDASRFANGNIPVGAQVDVNGHAVIVLQHISDDTYLVRENNNYNRFGRTGRVQFDDTQRIPISGITRLAVPKDVKVN
jgi:hypothetical protein